MMSSVRLSLPPRISSAVRDFAARVRTRFGDRVRNLRLFGSYARGDFHIDSDVDVLIEIDGMTRRERREAYDMAEDVFEGTLVHVSPLALSTEDLQTLRAREYRIASEIDRDGIGL